MAAAKSAAACLSLIMDLSMAGKEFEARLRQQHTKLNPKTNWARLDKKKAKKKQAFGDDSDEE